MLDYRRDLAVVEYDYFVSILDGSRTLSDYNLRCILKPFAKCGAKLCVRMSIYGACRIVENEYLRIS